MIGYKQFRFGLREQAEAAAPAVDPKVAKLHGIIDGMVDAWVKDLKVSMVRSAQEEAMKQRQARRMNRPRPVPSYRQQQPPQQQPGEQPLTFMQRLQKFVHDMQREWSMPTINLSGFRTMNEAAQSLDMVFMELDGGIEALDSLPFMKLLNQKADQLKQTMKGVLSRYVKPSDQGAQAAAQAQGPQGPVEKPADKGPQGPVEKPADKGPQGAVEKPADKGPQGAVEKPADKGSQAVATPQGQQAPAGTPADKGPQEPAQTAPQGPQAKAQDDSKKEDKPKQDKSRVPNTGDEPWKNLLADQKRQWNRAGGALGSKSDTIPPILRLGDPRRKDLGAADLDQLKANGRLELESDPIKDDGDLFARVEKLRAEGKLSKITAQPTVARDPQGNQGEQESPDNDNTDDAPGERSATAGHERDLLNHERHDMDELIDNWHDEEQKQHLKELEQSLPWNKETIKTIIHAMKTGPGIHSIYLDIVLLIQDEETRQHLISAYNEADTFHKMKKLMHNYHEAMKEQNELDANPGKGLVLYPAE